MSVTSIPNICPDCGAPTIDDRCEDNCGWVYLAAPKHDPISIDTEIVSSNDKIPRKSFFNRIFNSGGKPNAAPLTLAAPITPTPAPVEALTTDTQDNANPSATSLHNRVSRLETRIKSADQLSKYLLNQLDSRLNERIHEQDKLLIGEAGKAVQILKPEIKQELQDFAKQEITAQAEPLIAQQLQQIETANQKSLSNLVSQQVDKQLVAAELEVQIGAKVSENFKHHFAKEFQANLNQILLTDKDFIEIKKKVVSRSKQHQALKKADKLWFWLAGTSIELLSECPESEIKKYQALGLSMLLPIIMGLFACIHLAHQHFTDRTLSSESFIILAALIWAGFIMIIDRILLVSYRISGDWRVKTLQFSWRFFIALLFAMIFDASFLPTLYKSDVAAAIDRERQPKISALQQEFKELEKNQFGLKESTSLLIEQNEQTQEYQRLQAEMESINANIKMYQADRQNAINDAACEINGGPACQRGIGNKFNAAKLREDAANARLEKAKARQERIEQLLYALNEKSNSREKRLAEVQLSPAYQQAKQQAEEDYHKRYWSMMASNPREETKLVFDLCRQAWADGDWFTVATFLAYLLLFVLVDTFPIIMKILMPKGMYDSLLEAQDKALNGQAVDMTGNIVSTGFRKTDLGFEITEITARFAPNKSYTAWQVIQDTLEAQLDQYIRANWSKQQDQPNSGFASYVLCAGRLQPE